MRQYFKQELFFRRLTGFYLLYPGTKEAALGSKCDKVHIHNTQKTKLLHILCTPDNINCLLRHYSPTAYYLLVLVFHQEKNWLCWKCVINCEVESAIFWDFTHRRMVILTTIVLLDPWSLDR